MMTRTELEYRRVWSQSLQLPDTLSERHIADFVDAMARGKRKEAKHHLEHAFNMHLPLRYTIADEQPDEFRLDDDMDFEEVLAQVRTIVNASAKTRIANRSQVAATKFIQLAQGVRDLTTEPWGKLRDDEYYAKCTWLMHLARAFGQYLDVHL